jgi:hypothetical protein
MIPGPSGVWVWLAVGRTDMRHGMNSLAIQVQQGLKRDPHAGDRVSRVGPANRRLVALPANQNPVMVFSSAKFESHRRNWKRVVGAERGNQVGQREATDSAASVGDTAARALTFEDGRLDELRGEGWRKPSPEEEGVHGRRHSRPRVIRIGIIGCA